MPDISNDGRSQVSEDPVLTVAGICVDVAGGYYEDGDPKYRPSRRARRRQSRTGS